MHPQSSRSLVRTIACAALSLATVQGALTQELNVPATANIYGSGHSVPPSPQGGGGGTLPPMIPLPEDSSACWVQLRVSGSASCSRSGGFNSPDGGTCANLRTNLLPSDGISGIRHDGRTMFLVGVFLSDAEPENPAPPTPNVTSSNSIREFFPLLHQQFYIGDGRTSSGDSQRFLVPDGATRLFLGFADGSVFQGLPGFYDDNRGGFRAEFEIQPTLSFDRKTSVLIDPDDSSVLSFTHIFPDPAIDTETTPFEDCSVSGEIRSAVYWSSCMEAFAYTYQIVPTEGRGPVKLHIPFDAPRAPFVISNAANGGSCGLDDPDFGQSPSPLSAVFLDYACDAANILTTNTTTDGATYVLDPGILDSTGDPSPILGFLSRSAPVRADATLFGELCRAVRPSVLSPEREPKLFVAAIRGFQPSSGSQTGIDEIVARIEESETLRPRTVARGLDPTRQIDSYLFLLSQAPTPSDTVIVLGHSHGGDRAYRVALQRSFLLENFGLDISGLIAIDPIDRDLCRLGNCPAESSDQSERLHAAPPDVPFINYVQRDEDSFFGLQGYPIGSASETCSPEAPGSLSNRSCLVDGVDHTSIDCDERIQNAILEILESL